MAKLLGISRQALEKHLKRGTFEEVAPGVLNIAATKAAYAQTDPGRRLRAVETETETADVVTDGLLSFADARAKRENHNAQLAEIKYLEQAGRLIPREEVRAREFDIARKLRDRILGFPARLANLLPPDAMKTIVAECNALVRELQDDAAKIAGSR